LTGIGLGAFVMNVKPAATSSKAPEMI
jgi:hypothetical protein